MNGSELTELKNALGAIKLELATLKELSLQIAYKIDSNYPVSGEAIDQLITTAKAYREKADILQRTGAKLSVSLDLSLSAIDAAVETAYEQAIFVSAREIILDYFRLTAEAEDIRCALEDSKKLLVEKCVIPEFTSSDEITPYRIVVQKVKSETERLSDSNFDLVETGIGRKIARAADKKSDLRIDPKHSLSDYLTGSCKLLLPEASAREEENGKSDKKRSPVAPEDQSKKNELSTEASEPDRKNIAEEMPANSSKLAETEDAETVPMWTDFDGYVKQSIVAFNDTAAGTLGASKFTNAVIQKPEIASALFLLGHQKLLSQDELLKREEGYISPSEDTCSYLLKNNYISEVTITHNDVSHSFLTLTSKAWACYTKADVIKFFNRTMPRMIVPKNLRTTVADLTPANMLRIMLIHDYFTGMKPVVNYTISFKNDVGCIFGLPIDITEPTINVCAAVFEEGEEQRELEAIRALIDKMSPNQILHIIVCSKSDLYIVAAALGLSNSSSSVVSFVVASDFTSTLDASGLPITPDEGTQDSIVSDEPLSEQHSSIEQTHNIDTEMSEELAGNKEPEIDETHDKSTMRVLNNEDDSAVTVHDSLGKRQDEARDVEKLCAQILSDENPLDCSEALYLTVCLLLKEKRILEATVLTKTLAESAVGNQYRDLYNSLLGAANLPLELCEYSSDKMELPIHGTSDRLLQYCRIAAAARAMCFPDTAYDHNLYNEMSSFAKNSFDSAVTDGLSSVKTVLLTIADELKELSFNFDGEGFSETVLNALASESSARHQMDELRRLARERCSAPHSKIGLTGLETFMRESMGPTSDIGRCMEWIADGNIQHTAEIREVFRCFSDNYGEPISAVKVNQFIDDGWDDLYKRDSDIKVKKLKNDSPAKNSLFFDLQKRLKIIYEWLKRNSTTDAVLTKQQMTQYKRIAGLLQNQIESVCVDTEALLTGDSLDAADAGGVALFYCVFKQISAIVSGDAYLTQDPIHCFAPLLTSGQLVVNRDGYPVLDKELNSLYGMEPWRMALQHILEHKQTLLETLDMIEKSEIGNYCYENYGCAEVIRQAISLDSFDYGDLCKAAILDARRAESSFEGDVRLACAYGRIAEHTKETVFEKLRRYRGLYADFTEETSDSGERNFGHYRKLLSVLNREVEDAIREQDEYFRGRYENCVAKAGSLHPPILDQIRTEIEQKNYAIAEDYCRQFDEGVEDVSPVEHLENTDNHHDQFLSVIDWYYKQSTMNVNMRKDPSKWAKSIVQQKNYWSSGNERRAAEPLLDTWISSKGDSKSPALIKNFLTALGFAVTGVKLDQRYPVTQQYEVYVASTTPVNRGEKDYRHPVAKFGTEQNPTLSIVCLFGCKGVPTLLDIMTHKLQLTGTAIVLMDGVLSRTERFSMAAELKGNTSGQSSFLLIDRVLLLYLASIDTGLRMPALLQCTLPYTYEQLHTEGVGKVADEMFIGRIADRKSIGDHNGACLVYGGRQLGKTALLHRVESVNNKPQDGQYAIYIDIKDKPMTGFVAELVKKLSRITSHGRPLLSTDCVTLQDVCDALFDRQKDYRQLTVLIDEVDCLFEELAKENYKGIHPYVVLRQDTRNKVKFVFAGTHNVASTSHGMEQNSDIVQLGTPRCIEPLSSADATKLIKEPLSYLGFRIGAAQVALILANTSNYPGPIHMFCNALVKSVCDDYIKYYGCKPDCPPYEVSDEQLKAIFSKTDIKSEIAKRVVATIQLDRKYRIVSNLIAYLEHQREQDDEQTLNGFSPEELLRTNEKEFQIPDFMPSQCTSADMFSLMIEMDKMGILWNRPDTTCFRFRKRDFLEYFGNEDKIITTLLNEGAM